MISNKELLIAACCGVVLTTVYSAFIIVQNRKLMKIRDQTVEKNTGKLRHINAV